MKLQIDLDNKTIKIDQNIKIKDFIKIVKDLRPKDWAEYTLEANAVITYWSNPIWYNYPNVIMFNGTTSSRGCFTTSNGVIGNGMSTTTTKVDPTVPHTLTSNVLNYEIQN